MIAQKYIFHGKHGKYKIPKGAEVQLIKCGAKRKCIIEYQGEHIISMINLLRKVTDFDKWDIADMRIFKPEGLLKSRKS